MEDLILIGFFGAEDNYGLLLALNYGLNEATVILVPFQISGTPACVERAKAAVEERCKELEAEKQDRLLKSFERKAREMFTDFILV